jgi:hypothetical protein
MSTPSIKELAAWAQIEAGIIDAMGRTHEGDKLRLIASVLTRFETELLPALEHLQTEIRRLEVQAHVG